MQLVIKSTFFKQRFIYFILFAIYLKLIITIYEKLGKKCIYTSKNSLNKSLNESRESEFFRSRDNISDI